MSTIVSNNVQIGQHGTATNNFTLYQPTVADGTVRLANGNTGSTTDLVTVTSAGNVGIGLTSPAYKLDVTSADGVTRFTKTGGGTGYLVAGSSSFNLSYDTSANTAWTVDSTGVGAFTNGSRRLSIDSNGNAGLGITPRTSTGAYKALEFGQSGYLSAVAGGAGLNLASNAYIAAGAIWTYSTNGPASFYAQSSGSHSWQSAPSGTAGNPITFGTATTLNANGVLALQGGNTSANGVGIAFPATQNASSDANTLDDYEEGTFTPVWTGTTGNPTVAYSEQSGQYIKIGSLVFFSVRVVTTGSTGGSGTLQLSGLPFTSSNVMGNPGAVSIPFSYGWASGTNRVLSVGVGSGTTSLLGYNLYAGVDNATTPATSLAGATVYFVAGGCYRVST